MKLMRLTMKLEYMDNIKSPELVTEQIAMTQEPDTDKLGFLIMFVEKTREQFMKRSIESGKLIDTKNS